VEEKTMATSPGGEGKEAKEAKGEGSQMSTF